MEYISSEKSTDQQLLRHSYLVRRRSVVKSVHFLRDGSAAQACAAATTGSEIV